jgi:hypothetical protein
VKVFDVSLKGVRLDTVRKLNFSNTEKKIRKAKIYADFSFSLLEMFSNARSVCNLPI